MKRALYLTLASALVACGNESPPPPEQQQLIKVRGGAVYGRKSSCGKEQINGMQYESRTVAPFSIDYATVTCAEWERCVSQGPCEPSIRPEPPRRPEYCGVGAATVRRYEAERFCIWRGAKLPTWAQWHRAARGSRIDESVDVVGTCGSAGPDRGAGACAIVSTEGILLVMRNANRGEWTRELDCVGYRPVPVAVKLDDLWLGEPNTSLERAEFRCVFD